MARAGAESNDSAVRPFSVETSSKVSIKEVLQEIRDLADSGDIYAALEVMDNVIDDVDSDKPLMDNETWNHHSLPGRLARARKAFTKPDVDQESDGIATSTDAGAKKGGFFDVLPQLSRVRRCPSKAPLSTSTRAGDVTSASRRARSTSSGLASRAMANNAAASSAMPRCLRWAW
eukprot:TRINITY_DN32340_c0_g2_i1.p1 TRINITY_DN32340_c0_g2~~TRINITY_DN32340_c0_g2_i1.p1  ORF type:complete len:175 (+),score=27.43 TRINITY_DN32340_c0_g2_i1:164-688(+)